ncbi:hypothetical protein PR048_031925 [Dryococelus australis]|uniref:Tetrapyrrole biosynthesis uroporphyrinogen III synthase domain-containing protein n=1 Tax=Dryococelus australis TaxID=614101 RepID=A0ABQ9G6P6_9NEOP|nr:hypothetical protein PR048_031925 [Dryococelus australis]
MQRRQKRKTNYICLNHFNDTASQSDVVRLLASQLGEPGSIPDFSHVRIMLYDATCRRVFSRFTRFSLSHILAPLHTHLTSSSSAVKILLFRATKISSLTHSIRFCWIISSTFISKNCTTLHHNVSLNAKYSLQLNQLLSINPRSYGRPLLYPCSSLQRGALQARLQEHGVDTRCITAYTTVAHPHLEQMLAAAGTPHFLVYFSPSGVAASLPVLRRLQLPLHSLKVIALIQRLPDTACSLQVYRLPDVT